MRRASTLVTVGAADGISGTGGEQEKRVAEKSTPAVRTFMGSLYGIRRSLVKPRSACLLQRFKTAPVPPPSAASVPPPHPEPPPSPEPAASPQSNSDNFALVTAISPLLSLFTGAVPGLNIIAPFICWLIWKQDYPLVNQVGKNVVNAQISWGIYLFASWAVFGILTLIFIGFLFIWIIPLVWIILSIIYTIKIANREYTYQMPFTITFIK